MKLRVWLRVCMVALTALCAASPVFAYDELTPSTGKNCPECHGLESGVASPTVAPTRTGPHGGYSTGTRKCQTCHTIHKAASGGTKLLPAATIKATCESCHDGSGGNGVYGVLVARSVTPAARHRIGATNVVPGGDAVGGGSATRTFSDKVTDPAGYLTCSDCHSPHAANTVATFTGDRWRRAGDNPTSVLTNRLLKKRPTSAPADVATYGAGWCAGCHQGRKYVSGGSVVNHPVEVETGTPGVDYFNYENVVRVTGPNTSTTETTLKTLGYNNLGYVMPLPRSAKQTGHYPICQQCHEDARSVGNDPAQKQRISTLNGFNEVFTITQADGNASTNNPRFQTFPHESANARFLIETDDSLCLNCHTPPG
ncbi:MAG: cytochrome c3 family protein [Actinomycetota bacterium]|nr:cytochrome c3 family protein [Actinomycetota bacterium]